MNASEMARALLLAIDPERALDLPRPHSGQQTVIADAQRFNVLAAGWRWGKNTLAEGCIVLPALQGRPVAWFSPSYKTLADDWRRLLEILRPVIRDKNEQERRIELTTNGLVDMWSLENPDTARGRATLEPPARSAVPLEDAERILAGMPHPPALRFGFDRAAYHPAQDTVFMPHRERFPRPEDYYGTLFHEEVHATGHASRLDRQEITDGAAAFGSETYSKEELVAELGAAFLCGTAGIDQRTLENSAAYLRGWIDALRGDSRLIVTAASAAQKAADYVLGKHDTAAGEAADAR